jgi:hypothetical protein
MDDELEEDEPHQHSLEISVDTQNAQWSHIFSCPLFTNGKTTRMKCKQPNWPYWPAEHARMLCIGTRDWSTCNDEQRQSLNAALWFGFNHLLTHKTAWDENELEMARWEPLEVKLGQFKMRSKCGRFNILFNFHFTVSVDKLQVQQVVIKYAGPADMVLRTRSCFCNNN